MKTKTILSVEVSCDFDFIERTAKQDPFEYWNRCIAPGTAKDEFPLVWTDPHFTEVEREEVRKNYGIEIEILPVINNKSKNPYATHIITYTMIRPYITGLHKMYDMLFEAVIIRFGFHNVVKWEEFSYVEAR